MTELLDVAAILRERLAKVDEEETIEADLAANKYSLQFMEPEAVRNYAAMSKRLRALKDLLPFVRDEELQREAGSLRRRLERLRADIVGHGWLDFGDEDWTLVAQVQDSIDEMAERNVIKQWEVGRAVDLADSVFREDAARRDLLMTPQKSERKSVRSGVPPLTAAALGMPRPEGETLFKLKPMQDEQKYPIGSFRPSLAAYKMGMYCVRPMHLYDDVRMDAIKDVTRRIVLPHLPEQAGDNEDARYNRYLERMGTKPREVENSPVTMWHYIASSRVVDYVMERMFGPKHKDLDRDFFIQMCLRENATVHLIEREIPDFFEQANLVTGFKSFPLYLTSNDIKDDEQQIKNYVHGLNPNNTDKHSTSSSLLLPPFFIDRIGEEPTGLKRLALVGDASALFYYTAAKLRRMYDYREARDDEDGRHRATLLGHRATLEQVISINKGRIQIVDMEDRIVSDFMGEAGMRLEPKTLDSMLFGEEGEYELDDEAGLRTDGSKLATFHVRRRAAAPLAAEQTLGGRLREWAIYHFNAHSYVNLALSSVSSILLVGGLLYAMKTGILAPLIKPLATITEWSRILMMIKRTVDNGWSIFQKMRADNKEMPSKATMFVALSIGVSMLGLYSQDQISGTGIFMAQATSWILNRAINGTWRGGMAQTVADQPPKTLGHLVFEWFSKENAARINEITGAAAGWAKGSTLGDSRKTVAYLALADYLPRMADIWKDAKVRLTDKKLIAKIPDAIRVRFVAQALTIEGAEKLFNVAKSDVVALSEIVKHGNQIKQPEQQKLMDLGDSSKGGFVPYEPAHSFERLFDAIKKHGLGVMDQLYANTTTTLSEEQKQYTSCMLDLIMAQERAVADNSMTSAVLIARQPDRFLDAHNKTQLYMALDGEVLNVTKAPLPAATMEDCVNIGPMVNKLHEHARERLTTPTYNADDLLASSVTSSEENVKHCQFLMQIAASADSNFKMPISANTTVSIHPSDFLENWKTNETDTAQPAPASDIEDAKLRLAISHLKTLDFNVAGDQLGKVFYDIMGKRYVKDHMDEVIRLTDALSNKTYTNIALAADLRVWHAQTVRNEYTKHTLSKLAVATFVGQRSGDWTQIKDEFRRTNQLVRALEFDEISHYHAYTTLYNFTRLFDWFREGHIRNRTAPQNINKYLSSVIGRLFLESDIHFTTRLLAFDFARTTAPWFGAWLGTNVVESATLADIAALFSMGPALVLSDYLRRVDRFDKLVTEYNQKRTGTNVLETANFAYSSSILRRTKDNAVATLKSYLRNGISLIALAPVAGALIYQTYHNASHVFFNSMDLLTSELIQNSLSFADALVDRLQLRIASNGVHWFFNVGMMIIRELLPVSSKLRNFLSYIRVIDRPDETVANISQMLSETQFDSLPLWLDVLLISMTGWLYLFLIRKVTGFSSRTTGIKLAVEFIQRLLWETMLLIINTATEMTVGFIYMPLQMGVNLLTNVSFESGSATNVQYDLMKEALGEPLTQVTSSLAYVKDTEAPYSKL